MKIKAHKFEGDSAISKPIRRQPLFLTLAYLLPFPVGFVGVIFGERAQDNGMGNGFEEYMMGFFAAGCITLLCSGVAIARRESWIWFVTVPIVFSLLLIILGSAAF